MEKANRRKVVFKEIQKEELALDAGRSLSVNDNQFYIH